MKTQTMIIAGGLIAVLFVIGFAAAYVVPGNGDWFDENMGRGGACGLGGGRGGDIDCQGYSGGGCPGGSNDCQGANDCQSANDCREYDDCKDNNKNCTGCPVE